MCIYSYTQTSSVLTYELLNFTQPTPEASIHGDGVLHLARRMHSGVPWARDWRECRAC